jgi:hypothetical protein
MVQAFAAGLCIAGCSLLEGAETPRHNTRLFRHHYNICTLATVRPCARGGMKIARFWVDSTRLSMMTGLVRGVCSESRSLAIVT